MRGESAAAMAQPTPPDDDKYFDLLCHVCKRGRVEQLKTLLTQYNVRKHYSKRDDSGAYLFWCRAAFG